MRMSPEFVHLRVRSQYSFLQGAVRIDEFRTLCQEHRMPAVAITDSNNLFGAIEFSSAMLDAGVQPIIGCEIGVCMREVGAESRDIAPLILLVQTEEGYRNLLKLNSALYNDNGLLPPHIRLAELGANAGGLICLTGGAGGPLGHLLSQGRDAEARQTARELERSFDRRLYVEIQRHQDDRGRRLRYEAELERALVELAYDLDLPLVATNDVQFGPEDMFEAHDAAVCILDKTFIDQETPRRRYSRDFRFKSQAEMAELFADLPEAVENTVEIAQRCAFAVEKCQPILPKYAEDEIMLLREQAREGLSRRLAAITAAAGQEAYEKRLETELAIIEEKGFSGYFLIVADFVRFARRSGIPVGPGRGSGAGSLVAYSLTITDLDPIRYGLIFERFLNPERASMPDFDIDFCAERRDEVIEYVRKRYGSDQVAQVVAFGTLKSKAAVRDIARVLQIAYSKADRLAKMLPMEGAKNVRIAEARHDERVAAEMHANPSMKRLLDLAERVEGLVRNQTMHAGGIVIGDRPLDEIIPVLKDPKSGLLITQFDKKWVEAAGLVKFDVLANQTLTVIQDAVGMIRQREPEFRLEDIPLDDPMTFDLYSRADTDAVFQVESEGMKNTLKLIKPNCIEDIIALVALYRPGPMDNIAEFARVKADNNRRKKLHPKIDHVLDETYGIIVYQEQVMEIARLLANYTLGQADILRNAMGKKIQAVMDSERPRFLDGVAKNGVPASKATLIWEMLQKFAQYGFNKSHAAVYAIVSYQSAWLKANHPAEYMAAVMNAEMRNPDKLQHYSRNCRRLGIRIEPPCVNHSNARFLVTGKVMRYALGAMKSVSLNIARLFEEARADGPFTDLSDLASRVSLSAVGRNAFQSLASAGAFDVLEPNRRRVAEGFAELLSYSDSCHAQKESRLITFMGVEDIVREKVRLPDAMPWTTTEKFARELDATGLYVSGHPLDGFRPRLNVLGVRTIEDALDLAMRSGGDSAVKIAGIIKSVQERVSRKGEKYAFLEIADETGQIEVVQFYDDTGANARQVSKESLVVVKLALSLVDMRLRASVISTGTVEDCCRLPGEGVRVHVASGDAIESLGRMLGGNARVPEDREEDGRCVRLCTFVDKIDNEIEILLPGKFMLTRDVQRAISAIIGVSRVEEY